MASSTAEANYGSSTTMKVPKKLIVCCDGTWKNSISAFMQGSGAEWLFPSSGRDIPTNVTRLTRAIKPLSSTSQPQIVYYQVGLGSTGGLLTRLIDGATGDGLEENVREAYSFLASNYVRGDELYLTGFSRGAYTARSVAGFIGDWGLLTKTGLNYFVAIYRDYSYAGRSSYKPVLPKLLPSFTISASPGNLKEYLAAYLSELRRHGLALAEPVPIKAIAVWDTVGALGIPINPFLSWLGLPYFLRPYRFFNTQLSPAVENAFQALALDEHRSPYHPAVWEKTPDVPRVNLKQVWFPGVHSGVGGGFEESGLSNIALAWMMAQLEPFLTLDEEYLVGQFREDARVLEKDKAPAKGRRWAATTLDQSFKGVQRLLGSRWRSPGRYHRFDRWTARPVEGEPLLDTHEAVHYAVRSRMASGGMDARERVVPFRPRALDGWVLSGDDKGPGLASWRYERESKFFHGKVLPEEPLGRIEVMLKDLYDKGGEA